MSEEIILIDIEQLIAAYEAGLNRQLVINPNETNALIGYNLSLTTMEGILEANIVASDISFAKAITAVPADLGSANNELLSSEEEFDIKDYLYEECSITDIDGNKVKAENGDFFVNESRGELSFTDETKIYKKRFTNDFNYKFNANLSKAFDDKFFGKDGTISVEAFGKDYDLNFGLEKCFDCVVNINIDYAIPALEYTFDFSKQIRKIKELLRKIDEDLNPTALFKFICEFALNFGKNIICPSNLVGINLLLPSLFSKYSLDLASIRVDWTVALGPIIKTVIGALTSFVENIPRLIVPFLDCIINALKASVRYITTIIQSSENVYNTIHGSVEKLAGVIVRTAKSSAEALEDLGIINTDYEDLLESTKELQEEEMKLIGDLEKLNRDKSELQRDTERLDALYAERTRGLKLFVNNLISDARQSGVNANNLSVNDVKNALIQWLKENDYWIDHVLDGYKEEEYNKYLRVSQKLDEAIKKRKSLYKEKEKQYEEQFNEFLDDTLKEKKDEKKYFRFELFADKKPISFPGNPATKEEREEYVGKKMAAFFAENSNRTQAEISKAYKEFSKEASNLGSGGFRNDKPAKTIAGVNPTFSSRSVDYSLSDYIFSKYGIEIENKYKEPDFKLPGKGTYARSLNKSISEFVNNYMIKYIQAVKDWIIQTAGAIVLAFKSIEKFLGEYVETDIKILGNIQEILHLIRFTRLMYNLVTNGFGDCSKIKENKEVFQSILEKTHQDLIYDEDELKKQQLDPEDYIALKSKDGLYKTIIDLNDCSEASKHLTVSEDNLDAIYEGILNGVYR